MPTDDGHTNFQLMKLRVKTEPWLLTPWCVATMLNHTRAGRISSIELANYADRSAKVLAEFRRNGEMWQKRCPDLMRAIEEDRPPDSSVYDAVNVLEMIYAVYESSLTRKAVALPLKNRTHPLGE
ncbi:MAG: hypothetical protein ACOX9C_12210 [Kiritimatiellia bacterium]|jgi:hypothetical protein